MRKFVLLSLWASTACSNQVPVDEVNIDNGDEVSDENVSQTEASASGPEAEEEESEPEQDPSEEDLDSDGWSSAQGDCDDLDDTIHPGATELCDGIDNDCDGQTDPESAEDSRIWFLDSDGDGYGAEETIVMSCSAPSSWYIPTGGDCDDSEPLSHPGGLEVCDELDNDCDGLVDEGSSAPRLWYQDDDGDGYGRTDTEALACDAPSIGHVRLGGDCDDSEWEVNPGATERCSAVDRDCDGDPGEGLVTWFGDDGWIEDLTSDMSAASGTVDIGHSGTLRICEGDWATRIVISGSEVAIQGIGEPTSVILDGHGAGSTIQARSSSDRLEIYGLTVTGGEATYGGGIRSAGSTLVVEDSFIQDNQAQLAGGGIYVEDGVLLVQASEVSGNSLTEVVESTHGAGIRVETGTAELVDSSIYANAGAGDVYGGGISMGEADLVLVDSDVMENQATMNGGGIAVGAGTVSMRGSRVQGNESGAYGGGLKVSGRLVMNDSIVRDNVAQINGGGAYMALGDGSVTPSLLCVADPSTASGFRGNEAVEGLGGAVYSASTHFEIESDTCDWGADGTENHPEDVRTRGWVGNAYGDASFECNASRGCGSEDDMWTREHGS